MSGVRGYLPIVLFIVWTVALGIGLYGASTRYGDVPIDYLVYQRGADALRHGASPYQTPSQSLAIWRSFHQTDATIRTAHARGMGEQALRAYVQGPERPGPYLYPPTLALLVDQLHLSPLSWDILALLCIVAFALLWLRRARVSPWWLLLAASSWDVWGFFTSGNAEIPLLTASLLVAWLLWPPRPLGIVSVPAAAVLVALVLLVKPFYALFFLVFGLLLLLQPTHERRATRRVLGATAALALVCVGLEVLRWGPALRHAALGYVAHTLDAQWFALPVSMQTPMSAWNRTPLQALIELGVPATPAQLISGALWLVVVAAIMWVLRGRQLTFPLVVALSLTLLYIGRPIGWTLAYLDFVVGSVAWPALPSWGRPLLLAGIVVLFVSHWAAAVLTAMGAGLYLVTVQPATPPWETWIVLPLSIILVVGVCLRCPLTAAVRRP